MSLGPTEPGNPIAQEAAAQIQLGLFGTVGTLAKQLRQVDRIAPVLREGGIVRPVAIDRQRQRRAVGLAAATRSIGAFGGLLYAIGVLEQELVVEGATIVRTVQNSRVDIGDMTLLEADRRIEWKSYERVYDLLEELFAGGRALPELIMLDLPLVMGRGVYAQVLNDDDQNLQLREDLQRLQHRVESFWAAHRDLCFPFNPSGPFVASLGRRRFGSLLRLVEAQGRHVSPDSIDPAAEQLVKGRWSEILAIGLDRLLAGILAHGQRTAAFDYNVGKLDRRAFPHALIEQGMLGFHYLAGPRGRPIEVETIGSAELWHQRGGSAAIDRLAGAFIALSLFDRPDALPLPLWYAREGVKVIGERGLLEYYRREIRRAMREEQVDRTWLMSWDAE